MANSRSFTPVTPNPNKSKVIPVPSKEVKISSELQEVTVGSK